MTHDDGQQVENETSTTDTKLHVRELPGRPELFFGIVGPIGSDVAEVCEALDEQLTLFGYATKTIKLSALLHSLEPYEDLSTIEIDQERLERHMDAGDEVRRKLHNGGALAALAVAEVKRLRRIAGVTGPTAYIFRSLKHPGEVELFRKIYGPLVFIVSIYQDEEKRREKLETRLERHTPVTKRVDAERLMQRDEAGDEQDLGQDVRGTFPLADYFVDGDGKVADEVKRFTRLLFGDHSHSPTRHEYGMAMAHVAARRSADLSRQVGAAIMDEDGEVLTTGCNEVPKPQGGVYWEGEGTDGRDIAKGKDPNAVMGREILREIFTALQERDYLSSDLVELDPATLVEKIRREKVLERTRVANLIEFGRVVHAEMNALAHAARRGISIAGARLYCSTFPCHGCARHLLAAGISEVIYIEPYPKSLASKLYPDAIHSGRKPSGTPCLTFRPFTGVAPARYLEWFRFGKRKDSEGFAVRFDPKTARPRVAAQGIAHRAQEDKLTDDLDSLLVELDWL